MDKIIIFILFLGPLVFFHELGHFLFARLCGVRVEVFSIGFGPKLFKWTRKGTQYAISLIPLGGYVKMFGDDPLAKDELSEEEKKVAFTHKSKWARFWIVFGGPLANFILAFVIYFCLLLSGEKVPEPRLGVIPESSEYYALGLRTGDVLKQINKNEVLSFDDLNITDKNIFQIAVERDEKFVSFDTDIETKEFFNGIARFAGQLRSPIVVDSHGEKYFLSTTKENPDIKKSLEEMLESTNTFYLLPVTIDEKENDLAKRYIFDFRKISEITLEKANIISLIDKGFYPTDMQVSSIVMGSPADKVGLKKDDIVTASDGVKLMSFEGLRGSLQKLEKDEAIEIEVKRAGETLKLSFTPEQKEVNGEKVFVIGVYSAVEFLPIRMIETKAKSIGDAISKGMERTWEGMVKTLAGFKMLITAEVSMSNIGGPLAIGKVASDSFYISLSMFFRLMAFISINLGIINLFPIPVLDGGHILFIIFEIFNRGPLSQKKMQIAQQFGLSLLFMLIFVALFNDITRLFL